MFSNLISAGLCQVQKMSLAKLKQEVAALLKIPQHIIERIEFWSHQLWVAITGERARLVSYRCLPSWIAQVIGAIGRVANFEQLKQLGNILRCETENHPYEPEAVTELREAYRQKQNQLKQIKPQLDHEQKAQRWLEIWSEAIQYSRTKQSLQRVITEIEEQSQEFADLTEIIAKMRQVIAQQLLLVNSSA